MNAKARRAAVFAKRRENSIEEYRAAMRRAREELGPFVARYRGAMERITELSTERDAFRALAMQLQEQCVCEPGERSC